VDIFADLYQANTPLLLWIGLAIAVLMLIIWLVVMQVRVARMLHQYQRLLRGTSGGNLEQVLNDHIEEIRDVADQARHLEEMVREVEKATRRSMQWLGVVRFNPFSDTGGDLSFAIALVDGYGNGVVISSLHGRDNTRVYAKPLRKWESTHTLTDEEKEAIARAYRQQG
jgi:hypothetical protein